jgi:AraC family transcriptional regulator
VTYPFKFAGLPEPELTFGPLRDWPGLSARRTRATPGRYRGGGRDEHQLIVYLTPGVVSDCACESLHMRRVGSPYEFDFVPAGATGFWEDEAPMEMIGIRLAPSMLVETAQALELSPAQAELAPRLGARDGFVEHLGRALDAELSAPEPAGRLYADSLAVALSTRLLQNFAPAAPGRQLLSKAQIRRFVEYVEENLEADLCLEELSRVVGLSVPHMTTLFRRTMGQTVHSYVMERRVCRARALLLGGRAAISEVALEAGFAHQSHLARWMRRLLGVTPSELVRLRS